MLGLSFEAHLKTMQKQEAHLEVLILEKGRWHWLVVSHRSKKTKHKDPLMKAAPLSLNSESVMVGVCCVASGQTVVRNSWNLCFLCFSCSNGLRGNKEQKQEVSLILIFSYVKDAGKTCLA